MKVEVHVRLPDGKTEVYVGTILENYAIDGPDVISLTSELPAYHKFPRRIIEKKHITLMREYDTYKQLDIQKPKDEVKSYSIKGSTGKSYNVKNNNGRWSCDCIGFNFHRNCKHIVQAKSL